MDSDVEDLINVVYSDMPMDNLLHDAKALSLDKSDPTNSNQIQEFESSSDLANEDSLEPITETTMKMATPEDETDSPFSENPIPAIPTSNPIQEFESSSDLANEDSLEPITETTMKMATPVDETDSAFSENPIPAITTSNPIQEFESSSDFANEDSLELITETTMKMA